MRIVKFLNYITNPNTFDYGIFNRMASRGADLDVDKEYLEQEGGLDKIYLCIHDNKIIGSYILFMSFPFIFIVMIASDEKYKYLKVGTFMMRNIKNKLIRSNRKLLVVDPNMYCNEYYIKMGFKRINLKKWIRYLYGKTKLCHIKRHIEDINMSDYNMFVIQNTTLPINSLVYVNKRIRTMIKKFMI